MTDIEVIGFQAAQRFFELLHGDFFIPAVGAHFGHEHHVVALALERVSDPFFALAVVIFPGVVEEVDAGIERAIDDLFRRVLVFGGSDVIAAEANYGYVESGFTELAVRYGFVSLRHERCSRAGGAGQKCSSRKSTRHVVTGESEDCTWGTVCRRFGKLPASPLLLSAACPEDSRGRCEL